METILKLDKRKEIQQENNPKPDEVIKTITENVKNIVDTLGNKVSYSLNPGEVLIAGKWFSGRDIKTHDTYELKLTVKIPV